MTTTIQLKDVVYEESSHTGDMALKVWADTPEGLYGSCLLAITRLLLSKEGLDMVAKPDKSEVIQAVSPDREERLVMLMQDYLYKAVTESFFACMTEVTEDSEHNLVQARIWGASDVDLKNLTMREIKAVTYHQTVFRQTDTNDRQGRWNAFLVMDI